MSSGSGSQMEPRRSAAARSGGFWGLLSAVIVCRWKSFRCLVSGHRGQVSQDIEDKCGVSRGLTAGAAGRCGDVEGSPGHHRCHCRELPSGRRRPEYQGSLRSCIQACGPATAVEGEAAFEPRVAAATVSSPSAIGLDARGSSSGCGRSWTGRAWTRGRTRSPGTCRPATAWKVFPGDGAPVPGPGRAGGPAAARWTSLLVVDPVRRRAAQRELWWSDFTHWPLAAWAGRGDPGSDRRPLPVHPVADRARPRDRPGRRGRVPLRLRRGRPAPAATLTDNGRCSPPGSLPSGPSNALEKELARPGSPARTARRANPTPRPRSSASTRPSSAGSPASPPPPTCPPQDRRPVRRRVQPAPPAPLPRPENPRRRLRRFALGVAPRPEQRRPSHPDRPRRVQRHHHAQPRRTPPPHRPRPPPR